MVAHANWSDFTTICIASELGAAIASATGMATLARPAARKSPESLARDWFMIYEVADKRIAVVTVAPAVQKMAMPDGIDVYCWVLMLLCGSDQKFDVCSTRIFASTLIPAQSISNFGNNVINVYRHELFPSLAKYTGIGLFPSVELIGLLEL